MNGLYRRFFRDIPLRKKLRRIILLACLVALGLASSVIVGYEIFRFRETLNNEIQSLADVVGGTSAAALEFEDGPASTEILRALRTDPRIVAAMLFTSDGQELASFDREPGSNTSERLRNPDPGGLLSPTVLVRREVVLDGRRLGSLVIQATGKNLRQRTARYLIIISTVLAACLGIAYLMSVLLGRLIARPITELANLATVVSREGDYSVRAVKEGNDEIGVLIDNFNGMLELVEARRRALYQANRSLEARVEQRTRELQEATIEAQAGSRAKSRFLAVVSHELRTPLVGVIGCSELLGETPLDDEQRQFAKTISQCGDALIALVDQILDFSRSEEDLLSLDSKEFDLRRLLGEVMDSLRPVADQQGLDLYSRFGDGVSESLLGDQVRLRQVLTNLVGNAVKFTKSGSVEVQVDWASPGQDSQLLRFSVLDTGIGIPAAAMPTLFDPFTQADFSNSRAYGGTGLGLAISQRIVEKMGGAIHVESREGVGTTFWFEVPMAEARPLATSSLADCKGQEAEETSLV